MIKMDNFITQQLLENCAREKVSQVSIEQVKTYIKITCSTANGIVVSSGSCFLPTLSYMPMLTNKGEADTVKYEDGFIFFNLSVPEHEVSIQDVQPEAEEYYEYCLILN